MAGNNSDSDNSVQNYIYPIDPNEWEEDIGLDEISDLEGAPLDSDETPYSPVVIEPYVEPEENTMIPHIIDGWKFEMNWPKYEQQPFEPTDFPITHEPPHHTVPILVARLHELESKLEMTRWEMNSLASYSSVIHARSEITEIKENFDGFTNLYNEKVQIIDAISEDQQELVDTFNGNRIIDNNNMENLTTRIEEMEITLARFEAQKPSTSGTKKKKQRRNKKKRN